MRVEVNTIDPVRRFIVENFMYGEDGELTDSQSFLETGLVDSTGVLQLVAFLERHYGIAISDAELLPENLDSIDAISGFLDRKLPRES